MKKKKVIAISGPTATGKSKSAVKIAKKINSEIISADSRLIYKELNIGTAKPTEIEKDGIIHHLIDVCNINDEFSVANFCEIAQKIIINQINPTVIAGGTGLYFRILLEGYSPPKVKPNNIFREKMSKISSEKLFKMLEEKDPEIAKKIHQNNTVKVIRALEVIENLKIPMSKAQLKSEKKFDVLWFGLDCKDREKLYKRIEKRVDIMLDLGLFNEVQELFEKCPQNPILNDTIGYKEFFAFFRKEISKQNAIDLIKRNSRHYAKRQLSWYRTNPDIKWFYIDEDKNYEDKMLELSSNF